MLYTKDIHFSTGSTLVSGRVPFDRVITGLCRIQAPRGRQRVSATTPSMALDNGNNQMTW